MDNTCLANRLQVPQGELEPVVRRALARIDAVHTVADVPMTPILFTEGPQFGGYVPERETSPRRFELFRLGPHPELTLTHEVGHFLDHALGGFDVYVSKIPFTPIAKVLQATENSKAIREFRSALKNITELTLLERYQLQYWLDVSEQWARAYAQFIAAHSADGYLLREIEASRSMRGPQVFRNVQWENDDFIPIGTAIETVFRKLGWMP